MVERHTLEKIGNLWTVAVDFMLFVHEKVITEGIIEPEPPLAFQKDVL